MPMIFSKHTFNSSFKNNLSNYFISCGLSKSQEKLENLKPSQFSELQSRLICESAYFRVARKAQSQEL